MAIGIALVLLLTMLLGVACDDELASAPPAASEEQTRESEAAAQRSQVADRDDRAQTTGPRSRRQPAAQRTADQSGQEGDSAQMAAATPAKEEPDADEPATGGRVRRVGAPPGPAELTDVPGTIREDSDVRGRPGLAWPVVGQLSEGASVSVLDRAGAWFRVRDRDGRRGWVRDHALDFGDVDGSEIRMRPAPAIVAEWRGERFGVMGQSADQTRVALVTWDEEAGEIINAPIGEVRLIDADISLSELPILIGGETVVYPGDDLRAGQGRLLPQANEWMWLPWGWLLAQNDEYIWVWRPETDELEFTPRPAGLAKFSPDGQYLAIVPGLATNDGDCSAADDILILPLDGSPALSLREQLQIAGDGAELEFVCVFAADDIRWRSDSRALMVGVSLQQESGWRPPAAVLDIAGGVGVFDSIPERALVGQDHCHLEAKGSQRWWFHADNTVATMVGCMNIDGDFRWNRVVFSLNGEFIRGEPIPIGSSTADVPTSPLEGAEGLEAIGTDFRLLWSPSGEYAVVVALEERSLWVYEAGLHRLRRIDAEPDSISPDTWAALAYVYAAHDVFWGGDSDVAIIPKHGYEETVTTILIDVAAGVAAKLDHGNTFGWPCLPSGSWRPDGEYFQAAFATHLDRHSLSGDHWIDGTAVVRSHIRQHLVIRADGSDVIAVRTNSEHRYGEPLHRAEWSPDGEWFAIGGQNRSSQCRFGP